MEHKKKTNNAFLRVFDGYEKRHLELHGSGQKNGKGKNEFQAKTEPGPLNHELITAHLNGDAPIGVAPVKANSKCSFGVLDIDWYDMPEDDVMQVSERLRTKCAAFRSKSRGLHVYVFATEPIPAKQMHEYLVALRKRLSAKVQKKTEIFPKATQIVVTPDNEPTAVNLPLKGQQRELAFLIDADGFKGQGDGGDAGVLLAHIDQHCRIDADTLKQIADEQPVLDHSDMGYKIPHDAPGRNDLLMRIAMSMQARGWPDIELEAEIRRLNQEGERFHELFAGGGSLPEAEITNIVKSAKKREKGAPTPLHYRAVEKFNRRWSKITINGVVEYLDKDAAEFTTFTKQMLFDETSDRVAKIGKSVMPVAQLWLRDPDHARFRGVVCEPVGYDGPAYNVWRGFAVSPKDGDASVFEQYILDVLCGGDVGLAHWVTMYLADAAQQPTEPSPPTALALRGSQGGGKSFLQERILTPIFGERYVQKVQESERLFSRFNRSIFGATFIAAEEAIFHGSAKTAAKLKSFISSPSWTYEEKFKATVQAKNVHRLIATTNETQAVHIDHDDRRWTVIEVAQPFDMTTQDGQQSAYAFWEPYHAFMRSEDGPGIVLRYLLDYTVDRKALTFGYGTAAKARDKVSSDPILSTLHEIALTGICPHDQEALGVLANKTLTELVHKNGGRLMSPEAISHKVGQLIAHASRCRNARYCEKVHVSAQDSIVVATPITETRQRGFNFGTLVEFRDAVSRLTLQNYSDDMDDWASWRPAASEMGSAIQDDDIPF